MPSPLPSRLSSPRPVRQAVLEAFEPRILYAADAAALGWVASGGLAGGVGVQAVQQSWALSQELQAGGGAEAAASSVRELVVIDLSLPDAQVLLAGLQAQRDAGRPIEIITLQAQDDGMAVIGDVLDQHQGLTALHLLTHGGPGHVQLGAVRLDATSLSWQAAEITRWSTAFAPGADWLIYGCDVAQGSAGQHFVQQLALLSGADVAASDDSTGALSAGGDWVLEQQTGPVQAALAADAPLQQAWQGLMQAVPLAAQFRVNWEDNKNQNTESLRGGTQNAVARAADGRFVVVWTSTGQDGSGQGVYARQFGPTGTPVQADADIQVNTTTAGDQQYARVAMTEQGAFVVTWTQDSQNGQGENVAARWFDASGTPQGEVVVNTTTAGDQRNSVVGINRSTGDFVVAWEGPDESTSVGVFAQRFNAAGVKQGVEFRVHTGTAGDQLNPSVVMNSNGSYVVAWDNNGIIQFQRFNSAGVAQGGVVTVNDGAHALSRYSAPALAADNLGNFTVAFAGNASNPGAYFRSYADDGRPLGAITAVSNASDASHVAIAAAADGSRLMTWRESNARTQNHDILAQAIRANGGIEGTPVVVNTITTGNQQAPSAAMWDANHYVVVWSGRGEGGKDEVSARVYAEPPAAPRVTLPAGETVYRVTVNENQTTVATLTATDVNLPVQPLTWSLSGGADRNEFEINPTSGALSFRSAPNAEAPWDADEDNLYHVTVRITDGAGLFSDQDVAVTVVSVADEPRAVDDYIFVAPNDEVVVSPIDNDELNNPDGELMWLDYRLTNAASTIAPGRGQVVEDASGETLTYEAPAGQLIPPDRIQYLLDDGEQDITSYWRLNGNTGTVATDEVGSGDGVVHGSPTSVPGAWGMAYQFGGTSRVELPLADSEGGYTLGFWFNLSGVPNDANQVLLQQSNGLGAMLEVRVRGSNVTTNGVPELVTTLRANDPAVGREIRVSLTDYSPAAWYQYSLAVSALQTATVFIAGNQLGSVDGLGEMVTHLRGQTLSFGGPVGRTASESFTGAIDAVALVGHALTANASNGRVLGTYLDVGEVFLSNVAPTALTAVADRYVLPEDHVLAAMHPQTPWFSAQWRYRQLITLNNSSTQTLADVPVRLTLATGALIASGEMDSQGRDLRFVDPNDTLTVLNHRVESWNVDGVSTVWVNVSKIAPGNVDGVHVYYGNPLASNGEASAAAVWGDQAGVVLHMGDPLTDRGPQAHSLTSAGISRSSTGRVGSAVAFDGQSSDINLGAPEALNDIFEGGGAISAWINPRSAGENNLGVIADKSNELLLPPTASGWTWQLDSDNRLRLTVVADDDRCVWRSAGTVALNSWTHVAVDYNASIPSTPPTFYINGVGAPGREFDDGQIISSHGDSDDGIELHVGNASQSSNRTFDGQIDEFRLWRASRTPQQIAAEYQSTVSVTPTLASLIESRNLLANDTGSGTLRAVLLSNPANGTVTWPAPATAVGHFVYLPNADFHGTDSFTYMLTNGTSASTPVTVTLEVQPQGDPPRITSLGGGEAATVFHPENRLIVTQLTATDPDIGGGSLQWSIVNDQAHHEGSQFSIDPQTGVLSLLALPDFESPTDNEDRNNIYAVAVQVTDGTVGVDGQPRADIQTIIVNIMDVVEQPVARSDTATTRWNSAVSINVLGNDLSEEGAALSLLDARGATVNAANDRLDYTPDPSVSGEVALVYRLTDAQQGLRHYWRLDGSAQDAIGTARGTPEGNPRTVDAGAWGQALNFDGVDDAVQLPDLSYASHFTLSMWFRVPSAAGPGVKTLFAHGNPNDSNHQGSLSVQLADNGVGPGGRLLHTRLLDADDSTGVDNSLTFDASGVFDNQWHLYTLVVQPDQPVQVYIDGVLRVTGTESTVAFNPDGPAVLGRSTNVNDTGRGFGGDLDGVSLFSRALSGAEVMAQYTGGTALGHVTVTVAEQTNEAPVGQPDQYSVTEDTPLPASALGADWWNGAWTARQLITSDSNLPTGTPMRLTLNVATLRGNGAATDAQGWPHGRDLRFVAGNGVQMAHVVESWPTNATDNSPAVVWVTLPAATGVAVTKNFHVYFGNAGAADGQSASAVWAGTDALMVLTMGDPLRDIAGSGSTIVQQITSAPTGAPSPPPLGTARLYGSANDYVRVTPPNGSALNNVFNGGGTLTAWINPSSWGDRNSGRIAARANSINPTVGWDFRIDDGKLAFEFGFGDSRGEWVTSTRVLSQNVWQQVAVVFNSTAAGTPTPRLFVDGEEMALTQVPVVTPTKPNTADDSNLVLSIGNHAAAEASEPRAFRGRIDDVRIYGSMLDENQISAQMTLGRAPSFTVTSTIQRPGVLANDNTPQRPSVTLTARADSAPRLTERGGSVQMNQNGTFSYTPPLNFSGDDSFQYQFHDGTRDGADFLWSQAVTVKLNVAAVNDAPVIEVPPPGGAVTEIAVPEGEKFIRSITAIDPDNPADQPMANLTWSIVPATSNAFSADADLFSIDPQTGALSFNDPMVFEPVTLDNDNAYQVTIRVTDNGTNGLNRLSGDRNFTVRVTNVIDAPVAGNDEATAQHNQPQDIPVLSNDQSRERANADLRVLDVNRGEPASLGQAGVRVLDNGQLRYTPRNDTAAHTDTFRYRIRDGSEQLVHYWRMDGNARDSVGSSQGALTGNHLQVAGRWGYAVSFDGNDAQIRLSAPSYQNTGWTFGFWFKLDNLDGEGVRTFFDHGLATGPSGQTDRLTISAVGANHHDESLRNRLRTQLVVNGASLELNVPLNTDGRALLEDWHFYTLTSSPTDGLRVFIDGVQAGSNNTPLTIFQPVGDAYFGRSVSGSDRLRGAIDGAALWGRTLRGEEVLDWVNESDGTVATVTVNVDRSPPMPPSGVVGGPNRQLDTPEVSDSASSPDLRITQVQGVDPDTAADKLSYSIVRGDDAERFTIDATSGWLSWLNASYADFEAYGLGGFYEVVVSVTDETNLSAEQTIRVGLTDVDEFDVAGLNDVDGSDNVINQGALVGSTVGVQMQAVDGDGTTNTVTYSLVDNPGGLFMIDQSSGVIGLAQPLGSDLPTEYQLRVVATSTDDSKVEASVTIKVENRGPVMEAEVLLSIPENTLKVTTVQATDDGERQPLSYSLHGGSDMNLFELNATTGELRLTSPADRELPLDADRDNVYHVTVAAYDGEHTALQSIVLSIDNVDEAPSWAVNQMTITNGQVQLQIRADDVDTPADRLSYTVSEASGGWFAPSGSPSTRLGSFTQAQVLSGEVVFRLDGSGRTPGFTLSMRDGTSQPKLREAAVTVIGSIPMASVAPAPTPSAPAPSAPPPRPAPAPAAESPASPPAPERSTTPTLARMASNAAEATDEAQGDKQSDAEREGVAGLDALLEGRASREAAERAVGRRALSALMSGGPSAAGAFSSAAALAVRALDLADAMGLDGAWRGPTITGADSSSGLRSGYSDTAEARTYSALMQAMNRVREDVTGEELEVAVTVGSTALLSGSLSVGYVLWLLRGGVLMATVVSSVPAWAGIDPLPVLRQGRGADDEDRDEQDAERDADPLERLFSKARKMLHKDAAAASGAPSTRAATQADDKTLEVSP